MRTIVGSRMTSILLDMGGVLILPDFSTVAAAAAEDGHQIKDATLDQAHYEAVAILDRPHDTASRSLVDAYVSGFLTSLGLSHLETYRTAVETAFTSSWSRTIEESIDAMRALSALGHTIAIVSNSLGHVEEALALAGICQVGEGPGARVDAVIDSSVVGVQKPDPRIFTIALVAINGRRNDAVHVGDSIVYDVRGAQAAGVRAFHFDPWASCAERDHEHVRTLRDLLGML
jgi:putative hydrolase of the HAD superfamily